MDKKVAGGCTASFLVRASASFKAIVCGYQWKDGTCDAGWHQSEVQVRTGMYSVAPEKLTSRQLLRTSAQVLPDDKNI